MSIDRKRVAALAVLESMGWIWRDGEWVSPRRAALDGDALVSAADDMLAALIRRADTLEGATEDADEMAELGVIGGAVEAYETARWPEGKIPGGKG